MKTKKNTLTDDLAAKTSEFASLASEFEEYKESMKPYEQLSVAEAEARTAEAEQQKAEAELKLKQQKETEKAEKKAREKEEADKKAAEEAKGYETGITYDQLARTPDKYDGKKVKFTGKVIQVMEGNGITTIRLAVNSDYNKVIRCSYLSKLVDSRVLEDDKITILGISDGLYSYEATSGAMITIPSVIVKKINQ